MLLGKFKIIGHSMEPVLKEGNIILASNIPYLFKSPQINDIVVFRFQKEIFIKRVIKKDKNKYFLTGDNMHDSFDSKQIGFIERDNILGKLVFKLN